MAKPRRSRSNATALERTIKALGETGQLEEVDTARLQALRSMAAALDARPTNAQLWKAYNEALERLISDDSGDDDRFGALLARMRPSTRDTPEA